AMLCQVSNDAALPETEFGLDIAYEYYYANNDFSQSRCSILLQAFNPGLVGQMPKRNSRSNVTRKQLLEAARAAMRNAHAPYSKFKVGAALLTTKGQIFAGCNVENASYGMTNCAERTAIFSAVASIGPKIEIDAITIVNNHDAPCAPCGACRQVIYEFGPKATVYFQSAKGQKKLKITDLLPEGFRLK
ncbi:MAG: cytidine deaminase, partial [Candidatus Acidiferrales bacterium]